MTADTVPIRVPDEATMSDVVFVLQEVVLRIDSLSERIGNLEGTVNRKFSALGAGFGMMHSQLSEVPRE